ncbi:MAG: hypothetical protein FWD50_01995 [Betaproteobacteria bacterium]|nr:hypothetical protein [Betaproteobacteria bacterium]
MSRTVKNAPFSVIADLWGNKLEHLSLRDKDAIKERYSSLFLGRKIVLLLAAITIGIALMTISAFLR